MKEINTFRRGLPQFCIVGVKNLILLGKQHIIVRNYFQNDRVEPNTPAYYD